MKHWLLLAFALAFCSCLFASDEDSFVGFTTIKLSGKLDEESVRTIFEADEKPFYFERQTSIGRLISDYKSLEEGKNAWSYKGTDDKISYKTKNGKFSFASSNPGNLAFGGLFGMLPVDKGSMKCSGTWKVVDYTFYFQDYYVGLMDLVSDSYRLLDRTFELTQSGKVCKYQEKGKDLQVKITVKSDGKTSATLKLSEKYIAPGFTDAN